MVLASLLVRRPISGQPRVLSRGPSLYLDQALHLSTVTFLARSVATSEVVRNRGNVLIMILLKLVVGQTALRSSQHYSTKTFLAPAAQLDTSLATLARIDPHISLRRRYSPRPARFVSIPHFSQALPFKCAPFGVA